MLKDFIKNRINFCWAYKKSVPLVTCGKSPDKGFEYEIQKYQGAITSVSSSFEVSYFANIYNSLSMDIREESNTLTKKGVTEYIYYTRFKQLDWRVANRPDEQQIILAKKSVNGGGDDFDEDDF